MRTVDHNAYLEIREWVHRNARPLELAVWRYFFEQGDQQSVLTELAYYQNEDGGFGKTIDPDNWNPHSTPYNAQIVIKLLRQIGFTDVKHPIYQGIFHYLETTEHQSAIGWFFTIPSNDDYPHGVWWDYNPETNAYESIGTTASLAGFLLRYGDPESKLYKTAASYADMLMEKLRVTTPYGDMGVGGYCELLEDIEAAGLESQFDYELLRSKVPELVRGKIQNEPNNFMANPLEFVLSRESLFYEENKQEVEAALDVLIDQRPANGVWDIPWQWYNGDKYPRAFAISENWWKSLKATEKLLQLRRFNRLEEEAGLAPA
ncbi:hypothetical protein [Gorillibacterium timonense]|uniref:hypothetical protein n=1 Tax=Gorillibacterium timonense TaxID=1689269 RepID=UPI00071C9CBC|nr:hypothetical protein [Gorillibacterium timonense]